jgi:hypothetical protein
MSRRMKWEGHVTCLRDMKMHKIFWLETLKGKDHSEDLDVDARIL